MKIQNQLRQLGWELEVLGMRVISPTEKEEYRAICGGFKTPWRYSLDAVLNDVLAIKAKENAEAVGPQKARW